MAKTILQYPNAALYCSGGIVHNADGSENYRIAKKYINYIGVINFFENPFQFAHTSGTVINKFFFKKTSGSPANMKCLEDFALFVQLALLGDFIYIGLPISKYIGGVPGQITAASGEKLFSFLPSINLYYNLIYHKYDIRHRFKGYVKQEKYNDYFLRNLDTSLIKDFTAFELYLYRHRKVKAAILWINLTKVIWRLHKYPIVGEKVNIHQIPIKYQKW